MGQNFEKPNQTNCSDTKTGPRSAFFQVKKGNNIKICDNLTCFLLLSLSPL